MNEIWSARSPHMTSRNSERRLYAEELIGKDTESTDRSRPQRLALDGQVSLLARQVDMCQHQFPGFSCKNCRWALASSKSLNRLPIRTGVE